MGVPSGPPAPCPPGLCCPLPRSLAPPRSGRAHAAQFHVSKARTSVSRTWGTTAGSGPSGHNHTQQCLVRGKPLGAAGRPGPGLKGPRPQSGSTEASPGPRAHHTDGARPGSPHPATPEWRPRLSLDDGRVGGAAPPAWAVGCGGPRSAAEDGSAADHRPRRLPWLVAPDIYEEPSPTPHQLFQNSGGTPAGHSVGLPGPGAQSWCRRKERRRQHPPTETPAH